MHDGQTFYGSIDHYATDNDGILVAHIIPDDPWIILATVDADRVHPDGVAFVPACTSPAPSETSPGGAPYVDVGFYRRGGGTARGDGGF